MTTLMRPYSPAPASGPATRVPWPCRAVPCLCLACPAKGASGDTGSMDHTISSTTPTPRCRVRANGRQTLLALLPLGRRLAG